ncbi:LysR substrate-binding domain-containing protein [Pseudoalteromonas sp. OOF1S-7]|uniref:LysR substrate-binding domain-containing protein n=1 Tax=Pseudoalteromonas sp. OOF1S-7 TaxID=2917757 RepID=UPI001EF54F0D|nr:LysR substrate-binding domain-containing protein [Pseudoalteromonas sp. OOF1S-7]MCG7537254.1 LysR substrate-binding domain-containing protein [Pseudoalteromonas sp. OOF1S-7]
MIEANISLTALQSFAVVAAELSFTKAGQILHKTPSAISHQMKLLEQQLDVQLFYRKSKGVVLTPAAELLLTDVLSGLSQLNAGIRQTRLKAQTDKHTIVLAVIPSLLEHWLLPRLTRLYQALPHIQLELIAMDQLVEFASNRVHGHLHFGRGEFANLTSRWLADEYTYPVISPSLRKQFPEVLSLDDWMTQVPLLAYRSGPEDAPSNLGWETWMSRFQGSGERVPRVDTFSHVGLAMGAAKYGQGIALGWHHIAQQALSDRTLEKLDADPIKLAFSYYLVAPERHWLNAEFMALFEWLKTEFANSAGESDF